MNRNESKQRIHALLKTCFLEKVPRRKQNKGWLRAFSYKRADGGPAYIRLTDDEARAFHDCLDVHVQHFLPAGLGEWSKAGIEGVLQAAMGDVLESRRAGATVTTPMLSAYAAQARDRLFAAPQQFATIHAVHNVDPKMLPRTFGTVRFSRGSRAIVIRRAQALSPKPEEVAQLLRTLRLTEPFALAETTVRAHDAGAARALGLASVHNTLDVMNFYGDLRDVRLPAAAFGPEDCGTGNLWSFASGPDSLHLLERAVRYHPLFLPKPRSPEGKDYGIDIAHRLLKQDLRSDVETAVLTALQWAGRASVTDDNSLKFLQFAVALEALVLPPKPSGDITYQLRLRVSTLLKGRFPECFDHLVKLYDTRSRIVHDGRIVVAEDDVDWLRVYAKSAVFRVLGNPQLRRMTWKHYAAWFERQWSVRS